MTSPPDRNITFDWGDYSARSAAAEGEWVPHTYGGPGTYLITASKAASTARGYTTWTVTVNTDPPELTVDDATVSTCQLSQYHATITNGFSAVAGLYSFTTLKAAGLTAENTLYQRMNADGSFTTIPLVNLEDGSGVRAIFGPFDIGRDADNQITIQLRLPQGLAGPIAGHTDYVTSTVYDVDTGDTTLNVLTADDYTLTVQPGDCSNVPTPESCNIETIAPDARITTVTPDPDTGEDVTTYSPNNITTSQLVVLTGTGLDEVAGMVLVTDEGYGYPLNNILAATQQGGQSACQGYVGLLPVLDLANISSVLVQDADNTTRCAIDVDWIYTPGPIIEVG